MSKLQIRNSFLLLLTATIWGVAFVAQSVGMDYIGPFTFNAVRNIMGGLVLIPCIIFLEWLKNRNKLTNNNDSDVSNTGCTQDDSIHPADAGVAGAGISLISVIKSMFDKKLVIGGICCGTVLCIATNLQQIALIHSSVGKAGFLTALYIVIVPLLGIFLHKKPGKKLWFAVVLALIGLYLLCMKTGDYSLNTGDWLLILCAVFFSFHILIIDHFSQFVDGVKMSCLQFFTCGIISAVCMLILETPEIGAILDAWLPVVYSGVLSCGVAYTLQIVGQRGMNPVVASLIMSLESVVSVLAGWIILHEVLSPREISGCIIMFAAIILAQLPERKAVR